MTAELQHREEAFGLADALYEECRVVARFIDEKVRSKVDERVAAVTHGVTFQGQMLRTIAWLRSLSKLNHPGDFQAVTAAARALFESAADVTLMHFDPANFSPDKMDAWEDSAKLKHARTVSGYLAETGRDARDDERTIMAYATRERARIEKLRDKWWPNYGRKHPPRWTGVRPRRRREDRGQAARQWLREFYRLRYPQICWNVHGSGMAGIANIAPEHFPMVGGRAYARPPRSPGSSRRSSPATWSAGTRLRSGSWPTS